MIELRNVTKRYPAQTQPALNSVSFHVAPGEFAFVVGPSGSGKSTLLRLLHGDEKIDSGVLRMNGCDVGQLKKREMPFYRRTIGMVFQDFKLIQKKTVRENLAFAMRVIGTSDWEISRRIGEALELVGLYDQRRSYPSELSGGEQQRIAIARAILNRPVLLLADEPTGNLDPDLSYETMRLFERIHQNGTTVLVVTHEQSLVNRFQKRVIRLEQGQIVADKENGQYRPCGI